MTEKNISEENEPGVSEKTTWINQFLAAYRSPLGLLGVSMTTICFILSLIGLLMHASGTMENPYTPILTVFLFPMGMLFGLMLLPLAVFLQKRRMFKDTLLKEGFKIDLSNTVHRRNIILVLVLSAINVSVFALAAYEGYHYMDSNSFCGLVCHEIMEPEYTAHQQSAHSNVSCVSCHIGPGVSGLVKAKFSGLRQLKGVIVGDYRKPVPVPVHELPATEGTCSNCHSPDAFVGIKSKKFITYSNDDQFEPDEEQEILLNVGGLNPLTEEQEGIHWHIKKGLKVEYRALNEERTEIGQVKMTRADGEVVVYNYESDSEHTTDHGWRTMDCTDCHNRAAHIYDDLEPKVDFGFISGKLDAEIEGLREDSITLLQKTYADRTEAQNSIEADLMKLQEERHGADFIKANLDTLVKSSEYLLAAYKKNVWPSIGITWGTYKSHLGHTYEDDGFGCFRCHDDSHEAETGEVISQDCSLCHEEP